MDRKNWQNAPAFLTGRNQEENLISKMLSIETVVAMSQAGGHCAFAVYLLNGEKTRAHGRFT
jgi:ribosomal protein S5